ncbi:Tetratricopeptide repeat-containing protein [Cryptosporangium aurantiacum]|uniref:Tetratricopeptide repeat-containing protein n=2 Tax=Cryptosporangium aurantiacum TaxID=134849 RepID=A0A1M7QFW5_9ACTN|nr:Tetratricopeptide repeat-containing protein [Cryptosporangium aurantiacum]
MLPPDGTDGSVRNELSGHARAEFLVMAGRAEIHTGDRRSTPEAVVPRQLRRAPDRFVDRDQQRAALNEGLAASSRTGPLVVLLVGPGGAGKSALALHWLDVVKGEFPDGHFQLDLGGSTGHAVSPHDALGELLRATGVAPEAVADTLDGREKDWRTWTDSRRVVLLADDAVTAAQVRSVLPASPGSLVVVTSRSTLGALWVDLTPVEVRVGPLPTDAARDLLSRIVGDDRVRDEPGAAEELVELCGRSPLAITLVGVRGRLRPRTRLTTLAEQLRGHRLLGMNVAGDVALRAGFDVAYRELSPPVAALYRALGAHPGPEFGLQVAAAAVGEDLDVVREWLDDLADRSFLQPVGEDRYRFHHLFWEHAGETGAEVRADARRAIVEWYLRQAVLAEVLITPRRWRVGPPYPVPTGPSTPAERATAMAWLEAEHGNLVAAVLATADDEALAEQCWQLCQALWTICFRRKHHQDGVATHTVGIAVAERLGNVLAQARLRCQRGLFHLEMGDVSRAGEDFAVALATARRCGDRQATSTALELLGLVALADRRGAEALDWFDQAVAAADPGNRRGAALLTHHRGRAYSLLGDHDRARTLLRDAIDRFVALPDEYNQARVLTSLGETELRAGRPEAALAPLRGARDGMHEADAPYQEARVVLLLAIAAGRAGLRDQARTHWGQAAELCRAVGLSDPGVLARRFAEFEFEPDESSPPA